MRIPESLASLVDYGILEEVLRPLMSGKEAQVYLVRSGGEERVAKVYKEAQNRTFKQRAEYTEGRKVRNSRDQRAMSRRSRYGRSQDEAAWRATEVEVIYRLQAAGVRVPVPHHFIDGVLVMELIEEAEGGPAPRLGDLSDLAPERAQEVFDLLLGHVVRMLCAGVVHGDLSEFNVLMGAEGPVVIDFPQAIDAASNQNARRLLIRDVDNLHRFVERFTGPQRRPPYAQEMWELYERGQLTPETKLTGRHRASERKANVKDVLGLIGDAERDERRKREALGMRMPRERAAAEESEPAPAVPAASAPRRRVMVEVSPPAAARSHTRGARPGSARGRAGQSPRDRGSHPAARGEPRGNAGHPGGGPRRQRSETQAPQGRTEAGRGEPGASRRPDDGRARGGSRPGERRRAAPQATAPGGAPSRGAQGQAGNGADGGNGGDGAPRKRRRRRRKRTTTET